MNRGEMHTALKLELDKSDSLNSISFEPEELDYWLNKAIKRFVKTRYSGSNYKGKSFEESQKRTDDLKSLVVFTELATTNNEGIADRIPNSFSSILPADYWFAVSEECEIVFNCCLENMLNPVESGNLEIGSYYMVVGSDDVTHNSEPYSPGEYFLAVNTDYDTPLESDTYVILLDRKIEGIIQSDSDTYRRAIDDPYSEHKLYYYSAKPLRLFRNEDDNHVVVLISDGNYEVPKYYLTYIKEPQEIASAVDSDLPEHTHDEIIDMAAIMMIENIESPRIQTKSAVSVNE